MAIRKAQSHYHTYEDWLKVEHDEGTRVELIDGDIYMFASPTRRHQAVLGEMFGQLYNHLRGKRCKVYAGPIDVRLENDAVVVPDIIVVCDPTKLTKAGVEGAPDLIIEILSPSTSRHDKLTKFNLYRRAGVAEYWIVDPADNTLDAHRLTTSEYNVYGETDTVVVNALHDFEMDLSAVFADEDEF
ncbi:MAG: Uma2 family endonuclease [Defluviitaleaceae bacterium]|nr:Uma2 family endonuclease [Defluviitaleaceae bacterium]